MYCFEKGAYARNRRQCPEIYLFDFYKYWRLACSEEEWREIWMSEFKVAYSSSVLLALGKVSPDQECERKASLAFSGALEVEAHLEKLFG